MLSPDPKPGEASSNVQFALQEATNMFNNMFGSKMQLAQARAFHDKIKATGYNLGRNKASFATQMNTREYFEKAIRPQNKKRFESGILANVHERNKATFIEYDKNKREDFQDRVKRYMENIQKEEREEKERVRREE